MVYEGPKASGTNGKMPADLAGLFQVGLHQWLGSEIILLDPDSPLRKDRIRI